MPDAFTQLLLDVLLGLYPREWRNRYGGEVRELIQVLSEEQRRSVFGMVPSLVLGATAERLYAIRRFDRPGVAAAAVATVLAFGGSVGIAHRIDTTSNQASAGALRRGPVTATADPRTSSNIRATGDSRLVR